MKSFDVLIVGSGLAALTAALSLPASYKIGIVTKYALGESASRHAQGGVAAAISEQDSVENHVKDTLIAGAGLCDPEAVYNILSQAPKAIKWLCEQGVSLSLYDIHHHLDLRQEGGHGFRRIVHASDATGLVIMQGLIAKLCACANIQVIEYAYAINLITDPKRSDKVIGVSALLTQTGKLAHFFAQHVILATGGASGLYPRATHQNPPAGEGIAMAFRAGASIANLEFTQFHPTAFYCDRSPPFLISEALRGEGAILKPVLPDGRMGEPFMKTYDQRGDLAPRDVVARAISSEMYRSGQPHVWLDISHRGKAFLESHFPTIFSHCLRYGIDISQQAIPVVPAAHYSCGGIVTDRYGSSTLSGLYAVGEVAYTGLHGANRLASNSLLECMASAFLAVEHITQQPAHPVPVIEIAPCQENCLSDKKMDEVTQQLSQMMWQQVGIWRRMSGLTQAIDDLSAIEQSLSCSLLPSTNTKQIDLANRLLMCRLTVLSALARKESRGLHYCMDYPETDLLAQIHPMSNLSF